MTDIKRLCRTLNDELHHGTDRSCVIVASAILDQLLGDLVRARLVPNSSSQDTLFDGPNAPLSSFRARIDMSHRIGVVSHHLARDLHLIRRIRNTFAHSVEGCTFDAGPAQDQVSELTRSMNLHGRDPGIDEPPYNNTKGHFVISVMHIVAWFIRLLEKGPGPIEPQTQESIYTAEVDIKPEAAT